MRKSIKKFIPILPKLTNRQDRMNFVRRYYALPSWNSSAIAGLCSIFVESNWMVEDFFEELKLYLL